MKRSIVFGAGGSSCAISACVSTAASPACEDGPLALAHAGALLVRMANRARDREPETVIAWHRQGFRLWWTWKSRRRLGRPAVPADIRALIRTMAEANPRWGAPRIHGEQLTPGIDVSQATVAK